MDGKYIPKDVKRCCKKNMKIIDADTSAAVLECKKCGKKVTYFYGTGIQDKE